MSSSIEVIINAAAGANEENELRQNILEIFDRSGKAASVHVAQNGMELSRLAHDIADGDSKILVAGGGDGTVSAIAAAIVGTDKILGILPIGTLNHFAKDLRIPLKLEEAVRTIVDCNTAKVDVGEVNGSIFINNASLGLYPDVVRGRERWQRLGYGKWTSLVRSAVKVLSRHPLLSVRLNLEDQGELIMRVPFVFIGNNDYEIEGFSIGGRKRLDRGRLSLYLTKRTGRLSTLTLALRAFWGRLRQEKDFLALSTEEVLIETSRKQLRIAIDGEVVMMSSPFHFRVRPGALQVIIGAEKIAET